MSEANVTEAAGYWWSAATPENRVPGVVRLATGKHYELTTIGSLGESFNDPGTLADVTVFGVCGGTEYTLLRAVMTNQQHRGAETATAETWLSFVMIRGAHLFPDARFESASFRCTGLMWLWGRWGTVPEGHPDEPREIRAALPEIRGGKVKVVRRRSRESGVGRGSYKDHIVIEVTAEEGMTLGELERNFELPLRAFTACVTGSESEISHLRVGRFLVRGDDSTGTRPALAEINPWTSRDSEEKYRASLMSLDDVFFQEVLIRWLELSEKILNPMVIAAPRQNRGYLQMETFAAVSAVEQVQRELTESRPTTFADSLKRILDEHRGVLGLNSAARRRIVNSVKLSEFRLQDRLEHLLVDGEAGDFFEWFLRGHINAWAEVSSTVRNRLGHGLAMPESQSENHVLLVNVLNTSRNVIFLRLLLECGFPKDELMIRLENDPSWTWQVEISDKWPEYVRSISNG
ncbi:hypothetical protein [Arthrobacter sp. NPDC056727]|uniref:ApeA N-terminal domain 1-containing protein n=1 Tax=Arthrobacter sp. NPDC056727 TaxID=3345927 RepID=UPI00366AC5C1